MTEAAHNRVLIVEDEIVVAMLIEDMLRDLDCATTAQASTAAEALLAAEDCDVDFALLDINLGDGQTSFAAASVLARRQIPYAWVTGYGVRGVPEAFRTAPVVDKPIDPGLFREVVEKLIARGKPET